MHIYIYFAEMKLYNAVILQLAFFPSAIYNKYTD